MKTRERVTNAEKTLVQLLSAGRFLYRITGSASLFLTFDDGPDLQHTPEVLDLLLNRGISATFFLVGRNAEKRPQLVRRLRDEGHTIGLHTQTHATMDRLTRAGFQQEIQRNQDAIEQAVSLRPTLLRPPQGRLTLRGLMWAMAAGLTVVHYTVTSNDWKATCADEISERLKATPVRGGDILSFHDNNPFTVSAVSSLLEHYHRAGFTFQAIP